MKVNFLSIKGFFLTRKIKKSFELALKEVGINSKKVSINVGFISDSAIQKLNSEHRKVDRVTDVLSFPFYEQVIIEAAKEEFFEKEKDPQTGLVEFGDIVICENVARMQAEKYGHSFIREVCFLALHGFLHILGYDHQTKEEEENMNGLCEKILAKIGVKRWQSLKER